MVLGPGGEPRAFAWRGERRKVESICRRWRVEDGWWRQEIARDYYQIATADHLLCVVFWDRPRGRWFLERVYD